VLSTLPNLSYASALPAMRAAVDDALSGSWDVIVVDHLQMAWTAPRIARRRRQRGTTVVFVTHNHEASVRKEVARAAPLRNGSRVVLGLDARKAARLERRALTLADVVTSITRDDLVRFERDAPAAQHVLVPPGWSGTIDRPVTPIAERPRRIGVLGSFEWHVKQENLRRFLSVADPLLAEAGIELEIGGRVAPEFRSALEPTLSATRFVGWVDDVDSFLGACRLGVIAEPLGGGFKLKSLDYVFRRVPIAALRGSTAGLPLTAGSELIEAEDHRALVARIVELTDDAAQLEAIAAAALASCRSEFSWSSRGRSLVDAVRTVH
jgi:glycosyltransferase involved in cell wall biosynthesis